MLTFFTKEAEPRKFSFLLLKVFFLKKTLLKACAFTKFCHAGIGAFLKTPLLHLHS